MLEITVYGKSNCMKCRSTTRYLDKYGLAYTYVDIEEDAVGRRRVQELGYWGLPVVTVGDMHWDDFRVTRLDRLAQLYGTVFDVGELDKDAIAYLNEADDEYSG